MNYDDHGIAELLAQKQVLAGTRMKVPVTHWPRRRFTIANMMILVAIVAIMLAVPAAVCVIVIALRARKLIIVTNEALCAILSVWAQQRNSSRNTACCFRT